jgi:hypothetical protein
VPFLEFPIELRQIVYTTNAIESLNARFRSAVRNRGHFPNEQAAIKVLYLVAHQRRPNRSNLIGKTNGSKHILITDRPLRRPHRRQPPMTITTTYTKNRTVPYGASASRGFSLRSLESWKILPGRVCAGLRGGFGVRSKCCGAISFTIHSVFSCQRQ